MPRRRRPGAESRRQLTEYRVMVAEHPRWTKQHLAKHFAVRHQEISRWDKLIKIEAEWPELTDLLFTDQISYAALDTLLNAKQRVIVKPEDKVTIARKIAAGLVGGGAETLRDLMENEIPEMQRYPEVKAKWADPALRWDVKKLRVALIDADADAGHSHRETRQRHQNLERELDVVNFGPRTLAFLRSLEAWGDEVVAGAETKLADLETLREQERPVMAMPYFMRAVPKELRNASSRLTNLADQLWEMADQFEAGKRPRDSRAAAGEVTDGRTIDG